jgi:glycosyltransferase involved in cell wall biosynthesis
MIFSARPDIYIAISKEVQKRIKDIYNRDSIVVYPPVNYDFFSNIDRQEDDYYLVVSRLVPYKKVSLVIKAFNKLGKKLVVVGNGSEKNRLRQMADDNITFAGQIDDNRLREYYAGAKALIFPQYEDFGITPLEAQSAGVPVIAFAKGGALETIVDKKTGIFFETQTSGAIMNAVKRFEKIRFNEADCRENAKKFDKKEFIKNFSDVLNTL